MTYFEEPIKDHLRKILTDLQSTVNLIYFTQSTECLMCHQTRLFLLEFLHLTDKIDLKIYDFAKDRDQVEKYNIDKIPAIVILDHELNDTGVRFYGIPSGYEINAFVIALLAASGRMDGIDEVLRDRIQKIKKRMHIQTFISLGCSTCPQAVINSNRLAFENKLITSDMIESSLFPHLSIKYNIQSYPKIIINEKHVISGAVPIIKYLELIDTIRD